MKRFINILMALMVLMTGLTTLTACSDDEWGNDNPEYQNVFIVAFADWGPKSNNDKTYTVKQGSQLEVPVQLWCEGTRSFNAEAFVYVDTKLALGQDFQIVDATGNTLQPNSNGAYVLTWDLQKPDATKRRDADDLRPEGRRCRRQVAHLQRRHEGRRHPILCAQQQDRPV